MHSIVEKLLTWYDKNRRDLPWRKTSDPYRIWVSEIILQQTRVKQGIGYYYRFLEAFPHVEALAAADEQDVLKIWQGLGYYSRARNMHYAAQSIAEKHSGKFPDSYNEILALKGIGHYTAGAIASFAYGLPYPAVDGNVMRVLARLFEIDEEINTSAGSKQIYRIAGSLIPSDKPAAFNQALIEFGALWCTPKNPRCEDCPLQEHCSGFRSNKVHRLPRKKPARKPKERILNYLVMRDRDNNTVYLRKRSDDNDIWKNLYDFPVIETREPVNPDELMNTTEWKQWIGNRYREITLSSGKRKHQLSHQTLHAYFWEVRIEGSIDTLPAESIVKDSLQNVSRYPFPRLIDAYLNEQVPEYRKSHKK